MDIDLKYKFICKICFLYVNDCVCFKNKNNKYIIKEIKYKNYTMLEIIFENITIDLKSLLKIIIKELNTGGAIKNKNILIRGKLENFEIKLKNIIENHLNL